MLDDVHCGSRITPVKNGAAGAERAFDAVVRQRSQIRLWKFVEELNAPQEFYPRCIVGHEAATLLDRCPPEPPICSR
jgi:hypothetical protein